MTRLIVLNKVSLAFGLEPLLDQANLQINTGERIGLIGRNGAGKSSLLKVIAGQMLPDQGEIWRKPQLRLAYLEQTLPNLTQQTIYEFVAAGLSEIGQLLNQYSVLTKKLATAAPSVKLQQLEELQHKIELADGWRYEQSIKATLQRLNLDPEQPLNTLSGGWQRRAALAQALVRTPDVLLLDEPTNHLDLAAILWLEEQLLNTAINLVFITHDRALLQRLATRIIELDRGQLTTWPGDYANFLRRKAELLNAETKQNLEFDKKLRQEEQWIRQGIKARRTRNEGRVRALKALRAQQAKRRTLTGKADFTINTAANSGQLVIAANALTHSQQGKLLIENFSLRIMRQDRIGIIGPNGCGKTTLLKILLGQLAPNHGEVTHGTQLKIAYFDQLRQSLDLEKTVFANVAQGSDTVLVNGKPRHLMSYLADFLFTPQRALTPVKALSGGERNRLLLAQLFSQPANLLVLDEPTNDLDVETLELLEEQLSAYSGTLLLVSHDRAFLNNVVTSLLVFSESGKVSEYIGGYDDLPQQPNQLVATTQVTTHPQKSLPAISIKANQKLSYHEKQELENLPKKIALLEQQQLELQNLISSADFYQKEPEAIKAKLNALKKLECDLTDSYQRWEMLEYKAENQLKN